MNLLKALSTVSAMTLLSRITGLARESLKAVAFGAGLQMESLPYIQGSGRIVLGERVRLSGKPNISFGRPIGGTPPELVIGDARGVVGGHFGVGHARSPVAGLPLSGRFFQNSG